MRVNVGDVVLCEYRNFDGEVKQGIFIVVFHDSIDKPISNNFTALKISSKPYLYQLKLERNYLPFLDRDSWVNCNNVFRFREDKVIAIIGRLTVYYKNKVLQQMINYNNRMVESMRNSIGVENLFEEVANEQ